ncbi:MAG: PHP domain-containing protein [Deltaproteobacteria bacterium]|nr:PHP domain-containing protein [Deltaproteobacteria bacterium]MBW1985226.1 PHP domain-containing protein [Deltaproteobacteria bacterium]
MNNTNRILFQKPDLSELTKQYTVVDLHFHSKYSDGINSVAEIAEKVRHQNIGIAITDHNEIKGAVEIDQYDDILSVPGIEVTSKEGTHILIYFYDIESLKQFYKNSIRPHMGSDIMSSTKLEMEEIITRARMYKSVIISPHPYCAAYTGIYNYHFPKDRFNKILELIDGVEVINSENFSKWNLKGALLGFNLDKAIIGGSDGHRLSQIGRAVTYAKCKKGRRSFLNAVKKKNTKVMGKEIDIFRKVRNGSFKLKSTLRNYPELIEKNIKYSTSFLNSKSPHIINDALQKIGGSLLKSLKW